MSRQANEQELASQNATLYAPLDQWIAARYTTAAHFGHGYGYAILLVSSFAR